MKALLNPADIAKVAVMTFAFIFVVDFALKRAGFPQFAATAH